MFNPSRHAGTPNPAARRWPAVAGRFLTGLAVVAVGLAWAGALSAATIHVPNGSFEAPVTEFASPVMAGWEQAPQPPWYNDPQFPWEQLMGQFLNPTNGSPDHLDNLDRRQGAFLFALPDVAILQDYNTVADADGGPTHEFNAQFEAGKSYTLTVGVLGGGGGMTNGATLELALYFRDAANNVVPVGTTTITNSQALFPTNTHFTDFQVRIPFVTAADPWAGKRIGIRLASTVGFELSGGYWDVDNVRLTESVVPNASFESPATTFAEPPMAGWQKAPKPPWYDESGGFLWDQLMGQYLNPDYGATNHLPNLEGRQAAWLFAVPEVAIFQDYDSVGGTNAMPAHEFERTFAVGRAYALTVGVIGGGGGMSNGATFQISLYYRDAASNRVTVAATHITNTPALFPTNRHFVDVQVNVPTVKASDAWAGQHIGIELAPTVDFGFQGGFWNVDNVRLTESLFPNGSFESPETEFASPVLDGWQKAPQPLWYNDPMFPWEQLMGQFLNPSNGSPDHLENLDGNQAAFLFALPDVAIYQDYVSFGGTNTAPTHDFNAQYEVGKSYTLTVGVLGGGGGMSNGATFEISFYYRDDASNQVTVAATTITNTPALFPTNTHLTDFAVHVPTVKGGEPWADHHIGIRLASTAGFDNLGGYWDVDNVRLRVVEDSTLKNPSVNDGQFHFTLQGAPGRYEVFASSNPALPPAQWDRLGAFTNVLGSIPVADPTPRSGHQFYHVRPSP